MQMASRIQGITVEIGGDTAKLTKALQGVNRENRNTQSQLKDVENLLKLDPPKPLHDNDGNPLVAMHWQHRFNCMVSKYNDIYRGQMLNITPHVCAILSAPNDEIGNESEDAAIPYGTFGHQRYYECVYTYRI